MELRGTELFESTLFGESLSLFIVPSVELNISEMFACRYLSVLSRVSLTACKVARVRIRRCSNLNSFMIKPGRSRMGISETFYRSRCVPGKTFGVPASLPGVRYSLMTPARDPSLPDRLLSKHKYYRVHRQIPLSSSQAGGAHEQVGWNFVRRLFGFCFPSGLFARQRADSSCRPAILERGSAFQRRANS